jgi:hypothetical protein
MARCAYCKTETELFDSGTPVCPKCSDALEAKRKAPQNRDQIRTALVSDIATTTARVSEANREFRDAIGKFPTGVPQPDGVQRIKNASNKLNLARKEMMDAHDRLNDFIARGIIPEDLKRSG